MAKRLSNAGLEYADGFSLNVSNYVGTPEHLAYGKALSALTFGAHFVVDTSRNGNGAPEDQGWCNPPGRALGLRPTLNTGEPSCDAFLWLKRPGESDGTCNGGRARDNFGRCPRGRSPRARSGEPSIAQKPRPFVLTSGQPE